MYSEVNIDPQSYKSCHDLPPSPTYNHTHNESISWVWWYIPVISEHGRLRQEGHQKFETSLSK